MAAHEDIKKQRLLRMTLAHYKSEDCSEEEMHRFVTEDHAVHAAKLHARHGIEAYQIAFTPKSCRDASRELNEKLGSPWVVRDFDVQVEFYFRDMSTLPELAADPDFKALQAMEGPIVSRLHVEHTLGWVERYIENGKIINVGEDGKPMYPKFSALSTGI
ncbi:hypothetical protein GGS20DRAFT_595532 [Poronia punctata]|nr:hypothetical protein GGS20DRAFT_595532 [Poronia punctata]